MCGDGAVVAGAGASAPVRRSDGSTPGSGCRFGGNIVAVACAAASAVMAGATAGWPMAPGGWHGRGIVVHVRVEGTRMMERPEMKKKRVLTVVGWFDEPAG